MSTPWHGVPNELSVLDSLNRAVIVTDRDATIVLWNKAAEKLYGWCADEVLGRNATDVVAAVVQPGRTTVREQVLGGDEWHGDIVVTRRDGSQVELAVTSCPWRDDDGEILGMVGVAEDVTALRRAAREAAELHEQLDVALEAGGLGTWRWDAVTGDLFWDEREERLFGLEPGTFDRRVDTWKQLIHPDDRDRIVKTVEESIEARRPYVIEHRVLWRDGSIRWLRGNGDVSVDEDGSLRAIGCTSDVTEQVGLSAERERILAESLAAGARERVSRERLEFLASISDAVAVSRDRREAMRGVTQAAVPRLGDWCAVYVLADPSSTTPEIETAHADPEVGAHLAELRAKIPYDPSARTGIASVIRSGRTQFFPELDQRIMSRPDVTDDNRRIVRELAIRSVITVPLLRPDRVIGAIQFVNCDSSRTYTDDDVLLAEAVASRLASGLDNLRLTERQRDIATTLQAALLPAVLPEVPGVEIAVRYWAAGEGTEVGGDFYDVFDIGGGWAVVIGDVCGTGPVAAATTGLARHTIRASAWHGADHAAVLRELNYAILQSGTGTFCTVVYSTIARTGATWEMSLAVGGHPFPIVCRADGVTGPIGVAGSLVGVLANSRSTTTSVALGPGDVVVLYTDGVTDVPPPFALDDGDLHEIIRTACAAEPSADRIAERIRDQLAAILPLSQRNDDIALLVLRVTD